MILIIGGMCQGKHDFCKREFPDGNIIDNYEERVREELDKGLDPLLEAERWLDSVDGSYFGSTIGSTETCDARLYSVNQDTGKTDTKKTSAVKSELIILMREVGSGVVPMDKSERIWREQTGRVSCFFAERADRVYRMLAGIPQRLK